MKKLLILAACALVWPAPVSSQLGDWLEKLGLESVVSANDGEIVAGLKEALSIGSENAVLQTGRLDGYFRDEVIKILLPENFEIVERGLRLIGQGELVDEFVMSMNRAAETAAPYAKEIFWGAIKRIDFEDARQILTGGDTAATDYFRTETSGAARRGVPPGSPKGDRTGGGNPQVQGTGRAVPVDSLCRDDRL